MVVCDTSVVDRTAFYHEEIKNRISEGKLKLPVLPHAIQKVLAIQGKTEYDIAELSRLIHQDHTLAGHVLKVSNSSIYAGVYKIHSIEQAITRLGGRAMVKIAVSITMQGEVFNVAGFKQEVKQLWRHSLASGIYAQEISDLTGTPDPEMYMCGLMHQVGKPVLLQALVEVAREHNLTLSQGEVAYILDQFHAEMGHRLAHFWKMPASVANACLFYPQPEKAGANQKAVNITHLASKLADLLTNDDEQVDDLIYADPVLEVIGVSNDQINDLLGKRKEVVSQLQAIVF